MIVNLLNFMALPTGFEPAYSLEKFGHRKRHQVPSQLTAPRTASSASSARPQNELH
jgi:hypothetical protein